MSRKPKRLARFVALATVVSFVVTVTWAGTGSANPVWMSGQGASFCNTIETVSYAPPLVAGGSGSTATQTLKGSACAGADFTQHTPHIASFKATSPHVPIPAGDDCTSALSVNLPNVATDVRWYATNGALVTTTKRVVMLNIVASWPNPPLPTSKTITTFTGATQLHGAFEKPVSNWPKFHGNGLSEDTSATFAADCGTVADPGPGLSSETYTGVIFLP